MAASRQNIIAHQFGKVIKCIKTRHFSATSAKISTEETKSRQLIFAAEQNPKKHSANHVGKFYTVPHATVSTLFSYGLPKQSISEQAKVVGDFHLMIRQPALEIMGEITNAKDSVKKFIIYGQEGCGKTMTLSHVLHYCFNENWCILLIPSVFRLVHSKHSVLQSTYNEDRFDQPEESLVWLRNFQMLNEKLLPQIKTSAEYKVGKQISINCGEPITTVIQQAFHRPNFATDAVGIVLKEVQKMNEKFPVVLAADEFNGMFWKTSLKSPEFNQWLNPRDLSMVEFFKKLFTPNHSLQRGCYVMALSRTGMERASCHSYNHAELLRNKGVSLVSPYKAIEVPRYTDEELLQCLKYYQQTGLLSKDISNQKTVQEIAFSTERRPNLVKKMCMPY